MIDLVHRKYNLPINQLLHFYGGIQESKLFPQSIGVANKQRVLSVQKTATSWN